MKSNAPKAAQPSVDSAKLIDHESKEASIDLAEWAKDVPDHIASQVMNRMKELDAASPEDKIKHLKMLGMSLGDWLENRELPPQVAADMSARKSSISKTVASVKTAAASGGKPAETAKPALDPHPNVISKATSVTDGGTMKFNAMTHHPVVFLKAHVDTFTRKDGAVVQAHDTKVQAAAAPAPGEIGHEEHKQYGHYFRPGDKAKDREGNIHTVAEHHGPSVRTLGGAHFHPTKLTPVPPKDAESPVSDADLKKHPMYEPSDHAYFKEKGYKPHEIKAIWDRDHAAGHKPVAHYKAPDVVGALGGKPPEAKPAPEKKAAPTLDPHPNVIGKATDVSKSGMFMKFGDKSYASTGKSGKSLHDGTPVEEYKHEDSGHRVWKDAKHRVHADSAEEAKKARGEK